MNNRKIAFTVILSLLAIIFAVGIVSYELKNHNCKSASYQDTHSTYETVDKPVIYLYPEEKTEVSVNLKINDGNTSCIYPSFSSGNTWKVTAYPNGDLCDSTGQTYRYLYWEATSNTKWDFNRGFCVPGSETASFLEKKLDEIGLTRKEANEFIIYWLPLMQNNDYNIISFQSQNYREYAELKITPKPDHILRVFMAWYPSNEYVSMPEQKFKKLIRDGFTVVEWGGSEVKKEKEIENNDITTNIDTNTTENTSTATVQTSAKPSSGHPFTDKNGASTVFTDAEWSKLINTWAYTGMAEEMISHHSVQELRAVLSMR